MKPCPECRALVRAADLPAHAQWHADLAMRVAEGIQRAVQVAMR